MECRCWETPPTGGFGFVFRGFDFRIHNFVGDEEEERTGESCSIG